MIACVFIRDFAPSVERLAHPDLVGTPLLFVRYFKRKGKVVALSPDARAAGVDIGLFISRARALCPDGHVLPYQPDQYQGTIHSLLTSLWDFTNRIEVDRLQLPQSALCYLDLGRLPEAEVVPIGHQLMQVVQASTGLAASAGISVGKFPAYLAALTAQARQVMVVPRDDVTPLVAPFPVSLLPLTPAATRKLHLLCIHQLQQLAKLPISALVAQFGRPGRLWHQLAHGWDGRPVIPGQMPTTETLSRQFDDPVEDQQRLERTFQQMAEVLASRLEARSSAVHQLHLTIRLDGDKKCFERLYLLQPVSTVSGLVETLMQLIQRMTITRGIRGIEVCLAHRVPATPRQLPLFSDRSGRHPILDLVQTLTARYGQDYCFQAVLDERGSLLPESRFHLQRVEIS
jgi:nucleotidyltransferase/DNA polymerase involved in DNA repair